MDTRYDMKELHGGRMLGGDSAKGIVGSLHTLQLPPGRLWTTAERAEGGPLHARPDDGEARRAFYLAAAKRCSTGLEVVALSKSVMELYRDRQLQETLLNLAACSCRRTREYTELATAVLAVTNDRERVYPLLESGRRICKSAEDYQALASAVRTLLGDHATALTLAAETALTLKSPAELTQMAEFCCKELGETATAFNLYRAAAGQSATAASVIGVFGSIVATLKDQRFGLEMVRHAGARLRGNDELLHLAQAVGQYTDDLQLAETFLLRAGREADNAEQLVTVASALERQTGNTRAAADCLRRAEGLAATHREFHAVAQAILALDVDRGWHAAIALQLETRSRHGEAYSQFMQREQICRTSSCFRTLARDVHHAVGDAHYCRRLYTKAQARAESFAEILSVAEGVALHVGDTIWLGDICDQLLETMHDIVSVNAVVGVMVGHMPDGRDRAQAVYRRLERECDSCGCFIRLAISVLALLQDRKYCRKLFAAADQAALTQAELTILARSIEEKLQDAAWVEEVYLRIMGLCRTGLEFAGLIRAVVGSCVCSEPFLRRLHRQAESLLEEPQDLTLLAESVARHCHDHAWSREIYLRLDVHRCSWKTRQAVADSIQCTLGDLDLAETIRSRG
nr:hypothetical protein [uncultured Desulfobulbus sp.]